MAEVMRLFTVVDVAEAHLEFDRLLTMLAEADRRFRRRGSVGLTRRTEEQILLAYHRFNQGLGRVAERSAADATARIIEKLNATQVRPDTRSAPHLRNLIRSRPSHPLGSIPSGAVAVGIVSTLDRAISRTSPGYGPYWRAQEYGTGTPEVKSQLGRVIRGYFYGPGLKGPDRPRVEFRGGGGPHPIFVPGRAGGLPGSVRGGIGPQGGVGGFGTIGKEITGRHFIRDGANDAYKDWLLGIRGVEDRAIRDINVAFGGFGA